MYTIYLLVTDDDDDKHQPFFAQITQKCQFPNPKFFYPPSEMKHSIITRFPPILLILSKKMLAAVKQQQQPDSDKSETEHVVKTEPKCVLIPAKTKIKPKEQKKFAITDSSHLKHPNPALSGVKKPKAVLASNLKPRTLHIGDALQTEGGVIIVITDICGGWPDNLVYKTSIMQGTVKVNQTGEHVATTTTISYTSLWEKKGSSFVWKKIK